MEFKEDKSTISELRSLLGKRCMRKTFRGWNYVGVIEAVELSEDAIYVIANNGVRGTRDVRFPLWQCKLDDATEENRTAIEKGDKRQARLERIAEKKKKLEEALAKQKVVQDRRNAIRKLQGLPPMDFDD